MRYADRIVVLSWSLLLACSTPTPAQASRPTPTSRPAADGFEPFSGCAMPGPPRTPTPPLEQLQTWCAWLSAAEDAARHRGIRYFLRPPDPLFVRALLSAGTSEGGASNVPGGIEPWVTLLLEKSPEDPHAPLRGLSADQLTGVLVSGDADAQRKVLPYAAVLGRGDPTTVAALIRLTRTGPELRWRAALALSWSTGFPAAREAVPALEDLLRDEDVGVRAYAAP